MRKRTRTRTRKRGRDSRGRTRLIHIRVEVGLSSLISNSPIDNILDIDEWSAWLKAQVADLTEGSKEMVRMNTRLIGLKTNVHWFTSALENFLGRIQIDDGLRLVLDN